MSPDGRRSRARRAACAWHFAALLAVLSGTGCRAEPPIAEAERTSVILIVVDALRADHLGAYGYDRPTSPNIDEWAARGRLFERAYATSSWTLPSFGSLLTGHLPSAHSAGVEVVDAGAAADTEVVAARNFVTLGAQIPTVAEVLDAGGFATAAFVANPFLDPRFGLDRGFQHYDHYETSNTELRPAEEVVDLSLDWIDERGGEPFFLMAHLFDPHLDYDAPAPHRGRFTASAEHSFELPVQGLWPIRNRIADLGVAEREFIAAAYDEEVAYVDEQVGRLLATLEERGVLADSLVVLTSDHGEEFFEHGGFEHGHSMYDEVLRVPLITWGAGVEVGREVRAVSLLDVAPTILDAAGVDAFPDLPGRSLLADTGDNEAFGGPIIAERLLYGGETKAIVVWPHKAILNVDSGAAELFDLSTDAGETNDLAKTHEARLQELLRILAGQLADARTTGTGVDAELDEELARRLRALGYIR